MIVGGVIIGVALITYLACYKKEAPVNKYSLKYCRMKWGTQFL